MANTTNLDLVKPLGTDHALISVINGNMDKIDAYAGKVDSTVDDTQKGIAIVSDGDTHAAIAAGQFVYIKNHNTLNEGMYTANSAIAADASLTSSNVTSVTSGAANKLKGDFDSLSGKAVNLQSYSSCADAYAALSDKQHGFAQVASAPDAPVANTSWQIETWRDSSTFGWQKATHTSDDKVYQRHLWTGNWSSWESVSDQIAIQTGTIGTHEYTSNTTDNVATLFKSNGIVYINIDIHGKNGATFPSTTDLFSIPTGFRPSENIRVPALMHHSTADVWVSYYATITSGGKIRQAWSSTCDAITISSFYLGN